MKKNSFAFAFILFLFALFVTNANAEKYLNDLGLTREQYVNFLQMDVDRKNNKQETWYIGHGYRDLGYWSGDLCAQGYPVVKYLCKDDGSVNQEHTDYNCGGFVTRTLRDALHYYKNNGTINQSKHDTGIKFLEKMTHQGTSASDWIKMAIVYFQQQPKGAQTIHLNTTFGGLGEFYNGEPLYIVRGTQYDLSNIKGFLCKKNDTGGCVKDMLKSGLKKGDFIVFIPKMRSSVCDSHIGIYWGEDNATSDTDTSFLSSLTEKGVIFSFTIPKYHFGLEADCTYYVMPIKWKDDTPINPKLTIKKEDEKGNAISNAKFHFELLDESGNSLGKSCDTGGGSSTCSIDDLIPGTYFIEETIPSSSQSEYIRLQGCIGCKNNKVENGEEDFKFRVKVEIKSSDIIKNITIRNMHKTPENPKLNIKKTDETGEAISGSKFHFELLDEFGNSLGKSCETGGGDPDCDILDISPGKYIIEETMPRTSQYNQLASCDGCSDNKVESIDDDPDFLKFRVKIRIAASDVKKDITIKNRKNELSCTEKVEECGSGNKACLLEVWKEFKKKRILDFDDPHCDDEVDCKVDATIDCSLNVSYSDGVTDDDWSCATVQSLDADKYYFCGVKFNLKASQSYKDQTDRIDKGVESGELYFNVTDGILIVGNASLTTTCYSSEDLDAPISSIKGTKIYDYIKVSLNGERLKGISSDPVEEKSEDGGIHKVVIEYKDIKFKYETEKIVKKITGQPCDDASENGCVGIGYGMLSKFGSNGTLDAEFKVDYDAINHRGTLSKSCRYKSTPKLITKKEDGDWRQNIEFRTISKAKPFTTKDGGTRDTKSNWCDKVADNCAFDNDVVKTYITDANDSYNSRSDEPEYTIILTPSDIKRIRDDIKSSPDLKYDDGSTLKYDDVTDTWYSEYLNELENDGILKRKQQEG